VEAPCLVQQNQEFYAEPTVFHRNARPYGFEIGFRNSFFGMVLGVSSVVFNGCVSKAKTTQKTTQQTATFYALATMLSRNTPQPFSFKQILIGRCLYGYFLNRLSCSSS
jgi:hypothetical protein